MSAVDCSEPEWNELIDFCANIESFKMNSGDYGATRTSQPPNRASTDEFIHLKETFCSEIEFIKSVSLILINLSKANVK